MEYDVEIKPAKLMKGQGLAKLLADSNCEALGLDLMTEKPIQEELPRGKDKEQIMNRYAESVWYADIVYFLLYLQCPKHLDKKEVRSLKLKATKYYLIHHQLH